MTTLQQPTWLLACKGHRAFGEQGPQAFTPSPAAPMALGHSAEAAQQVARRLRAWEVSFMEGRAGQQPWMSRKPQGHRGSCTWRLPTLLRKGRPLPPPRESYSPSGSFALPPLTSQSSITAHTFSPTIRKQRAVTVTSLLQIGPVSKILKHWLTWACFQRKLHSLTSWPPGIPGETVG